MSSGQSSSLLRSLPCLIAALAAAPGRAPAQSIPAGPPPPAGESVVQLNPFEVQATSDNSYGALDTNSLTSFKARLDRLPVSADVYDEAFMKDTNWATDSLEDLVSAYTAGAGQGSPAGDPTGGVAQPFDRGNANNGIELRGLASTVIRQDGFMPPVTISTATTGTFGLERVDVVFGPQSILYGNGGPGGVINLVTAQARFNQQKGTVLYAVDEYGHKTAQADYNLSAGPVALRVMTMNQFLGSYRMDVGGPFYGYQAQLAIKLPHQTVLRFTGKLTQFDRVENTSVSLNAGSAAIDSRNGQTLHYLLATNQINAPLSGAAGAGVIDNGFLNWGNVDSLGGVTKAENSKTFFSTMQADTVWTDWLSSEVDLGYSGVYDQYALQSINFYAPTATTNPIPGHWVAATASTTASIAQEPQRTKGIRAQLLITKDLFHGLAHTQTTVGSDFYRQDVANIQYVYALADSNFNTIISSTSTANHGRTFLPAIPWIVDHGPVKYPIWQAGAPRVNYQGQNYQLQINNTVDPSRISPADPEGVTPGGTFYLQSGAISRGIYGVNYTQWDDGLFDTLAGFRYAGAYYKLASHLPPPQSGEANNLNGNVGADMRLGRYLRAFVSLSEGYNYPATLLTYTADPYGAPPRLNTSFGQEVGIKLVDPVASRYSGQLSVYHASSKNEQYSIASQLFNDINPSGLNGRYGGTPSTYVNLDRKTEGVELTGTANPVPEWRIRLSAAFTKGQLATNTSYLQLYNDQFHENSSGQVTYADGTVVYVNPTYNSKVFATTTTPGAVPLTVSMMSDPTSAYYANPVPVTGQINAASNAGKVLLAAGDPNVSAHGTILTGAVGQPISGVQINPGFALPKNIITSVVGDSTAGYPQYALNLTNVYTFGSGWLKGLKVGGTINLGWRRVDYYYYVSSYVPGTPRKLLDWPDTRRFDGILGYSRRLKRVTWSTQLNISNLFNRYHVVILPNQVNGYAGPDDATFDQQPRNFVWSNTLTF